MEERGTCLYFSKRSGLTASPARPVTQVNSRVSPAAAGILQAHQYRCTMSDISVRHVSYAVNCPVADARHWRRY